MSEAAKIAAAYNLEPEVGEEVVRVATMLGAHPFDLANLINFESRWNPAARNARSDASGLIQFMPKTAVRLGTTTTAIRKMNRMTQMRLVERYLAPYAGRVRSAASLFMAVFYPAAMDWSPSRAFSSVVQRANPGITTPAEYVAKALRSAKLPSSSSSTALTAEVTAGRHVSSPARVEPRWGWIVGSSVVAALVVALVWRVRSRRAAASTSGRIVQ